MAPSGAKIASVNTLALLADFVQARKWREKTEITLFTLPPFQGKIYAILLAQAINFFVAGDALFSDGSIMPSCRLQAGSNGAV